MFDFGRLSGSVYDSHDDGHPRHDPHGPFHDFRNDFRIHQQMGFLKRIFSLGSKKSKRSKQQARQEQNGRLVHTADSVDGEATRLLRSASAHWAESSKSDHFLAPPLRESRCFAAQGRV